MPVTHKYIGSSLIAMALLAWVAHAESQQTIANPLVRPALLQGTPQQVRRQRTVAVLLNQKPPDGRTRRNYVGRQSDVLHRKISIFGNRL